MKLVTIDTGRGGTAGALLPSNEVLNFAKAALSHGPEAWLPASVRDLLEAGPEGMDVARALVARVQGADAATLEDLRRIGALTPFASTPLLAPVPDPRLIVAVGLAYKSHLAEMANTPAPPHPSAFLKIQASVNGPEGTIHAPPQAEGWLDFEGELAIVIGRPCFNVSVEDALSYVAGYTVCNDVSARNWCPEVWAATDPWPARWTWEVNIMGKNLPGFTPIGPVLTTADEIPDPHKLQLTTRLNGTVMQSAETSDTIFSFAEQISYFSRWYAFQPGDIITTGTPAGVGVGRNPRVFMQPGDVIEVEISNIGVLRNKIV